MADSGQRSGHVAHEMLRYPCRGVLALRKPAGGNMKVEMFILRGLYAMTALAILFGIGAFLFHAH